VEESKMRHLNVLVLFVLLLAADAAAQTTSGSMSGSVVDESGQVVPGAAVVIVNEATAEQREAVTNEVGAFVFAALTPGPYTIRAKMTGFKPLEVKGRVVQANNRLTVGALKLEVGALTEEVSVSARGETVATTVTSHQAVLDLQQVTNLSIRGRDPISLLKVLPGVSLLPNDQEVFGGSFATNVPNIQGGRGQTIYVDGINGGDGGGGGNFSGATNLDAVQEVNVQMSVYDAEYGLKGGAQVNFITKRGTSSFHGTAYTYQRDKSLNATNFFNNKDGVPKPEYRFSTLGGNVGGPVPKVPKVNGDGKKLFFFYSIDDTQLKDPNIVRRYTMPTALERAGDFSQTRTTSGALVPVRDPTTGANFADNKIPANRASAQGLALMNLLPMPNATGSGYNYVYQEPSIPHPRRQHLGRVDYRPTNIDSLSVKGQTWYTKSSGYNVAGASARWGLVRQRYDFTADQLKIDYTRIISNNTVLEVGGGKFYSTELGPPESEEALAGIQRSSYGALASLPQFAAMHNPLNLIPKVTFGTLQSAQGGDQSPNITYDNRWPITGADTAIAISANLTHTRGSHTFKAGFLREHERFTQARSGTFAGDFNVQNDTNNPNNAGFAFANLYLGQITTYTESMGRVPDNRWQTTWAWYAQDTWRPHRTLTLNYGLRMYKWAAPLSPTGEASGFSFERFDPTWGGKPPVLYRPVLVNGVRRAQNPLTGETLPTPFIGQMVPGSGYTCGVITPDTPCGINGVVLQNDGQYVDGGEGFVEPLPLQYDPRFGLAYSPNSKTVIRLSGGAFHDGTGGAFFQGGPSFRFDRVIRYTDFGSYMTGTGTTSPTNVSGTERTNSKRPVSYKYTLGVQRELRWNVVMDVAYVGDTTQDILQDYNYNALPAGVRFRPESRDPTVAATPANPGALPDVFLRPIQGFGDINISAPIGRSWYDSLQLQLSRRFIGGFELAGAYTWAKRIDTVRREDNPVPSGNARNLETNEHVVVASYQIEIPNGTRLVKWEPAKWVLDNWRLSGISTFGTGRWSDVTATHTDNFDFSGGGTTCGNLNMTGDPNLSRGDRSVDRWFDTTVFQRPAGRGDIGNNCYNAKVQLPGFTNHDLSIFKDFPMRGSQKMQLRWEIYNLFNHPQWDAVDTSAQFDAAGNQTDVNFGKVTSARTERRMQVSLRYVF
jgi:Carboxypeptidase regulatory-like domain